MRIITFDECAQTTMENLFTSRQWIDLLRQEYSFNFKALVKGDDRTPILIFAEISDIFGDRIISLPFCDYMEPAVSCADELSAVFEYLRDAYKDHSITIRLHGQINDTEKIGYKNIRTAVCHRISLSSSMDEVWKKTNHAFRKGVNKAKAGNLYVEQVNSEVGIDFFYRILSRLRKDKFHILPQTKSFYLRMLDLFVRKGQGNIWVAFLEGKPLAAAIVLHSNNALFDKMGVSDEDYLNLRPNNLLLFEIMAYGNSIGYDYLDMGLTQTDYTGLMRFKDSLGGVKTPINFYKYTPPGCDVRREKEIKELLSHLTKIFVDIDMQEDVVQQASGLLYKYFC